MEADCFDHQKLCCLLCLTGRHRECKNVQAFEEMTNLDTDRYNSFKSELGKVKAKVEQLIEEKKNEYETLVSSFKYVVLAAITSAALIKDKVDILPSSFSFTAKYFICRTKSSFRREVEICRKFIKLCYFNDEHYKICSRLGSKNKNVFF